MTGDLNINLVEPEVAQREEDITATLETEGLEDMADMAVHFLPRRRRWCRYERTWCML